MSSYTKSTDFASKDALLTGNPLKVVKGTEIDDEFNAIQTAVNSKADVNSPDLTGTPTAPTAAAATNTTQIASTAMVQSALAQAGVIDTTQLADDAVTSAKIADDVALGGNPTTTTQTVSDDSTKLATTAFVRDAIAEYAPSSTGGSEFASAASDTITVTYGPSGKVTVFGSAGRNAAFADFGNNTFTLKKSGVTVRSTTLQTTETEGRFSSASATLMFTATGTPGATESWSMESSGTGTAVFANIAYIGF